MKRYHLLTPFESSIIVNACTESPGSEAYQKCPGVGVYLCYRCDAPLYLSNHQFSSGCGWPSFDDELEGAIRRLPDSDGRRTEIQCSTCGAHLGHVFEGEGFTSKNLRHCVNSTSLRFVPAYTENGLENAYFAGGCFWGLQYLLNQARGVVCTEVGYMGGQVSNPTYQEVCNGSTGHAEVVRICFDPSQTSFWDIAKLFFECHDPFDFGGQGPDRGDQYRSAIFYVSEKQRLVAQDLKNKLEKKQKVATIITPARLFYLETVSELIF